MNQAWLRVALGVWMPSIIAACGVPATAPTVSEPAAVVHQPVTATPPAPELPDSPSASATPTQGPPSTIEQAAPPPTPATPVEQTPVPLVQVKEPYAHYPALDLRQVPFHSSAGVWGEAQPIRAPALPNVRDERRVRTAAEFTAAVANGRRLIVVSGAKLTVNVVGRDDLEILIEDGAVISKLWAGNNRRLHVHGAHKGKRSAGRLDAIDSYAGPITDLVIDGLDSVPGDEQGSFFQHGGAGRLERVALTNLRVLGGLGLWGADASDVVIAGMNAQNPTDWWWWRLETPGRFERVVVFECHLRMYAQPVLRMHQPGKIWFGRTTLVNSTQLRPGPTPPPATGFVLRISHADDHVWLSDVRIHAQGLLQHPPGSGRYVHPSAEVVPGGHPKPRLLHVDANTTIVSDALDVRAVRARADATWSVAARVVPTAGNPVPDWSDRNHAGDPTELLSQRR